MITVQVQLFAAYREAVGARQIPLDVPQGATVLDVWQQLQGQYPKLRTPRPVAAINDAYATLDTVVQPGDLIAYLPPVSGGVVSFPLPVGEGARQAIPCAEVTVVCSSSPPNP